MWYWSDLILIWSDLIWSDMIWYWYDHSGFSESICHCGGNIFGFDFFSLELHVEVLERPHIIVISFDLAWFADMEWQPPHYLSNYLCIYLFFFAYRACHCLCWKPWHMYIYIYIYILLLLCYFVFVFFFIFTQNKGSTGLSTTLCRFWPLHCQLSQY